MWPWRIAELASAQAKKLFPHPVGPVTSTLWCSLTHAPWAKPKMTERSRPRGARKSMSSTAGRVAQLGRLSAGRPSAGCRGHRLLCRPTGRAGRRRSARRRSRGGQLLGQAGGHGRQAEAPPISRWSGWGTSLRLLFVGVITRPAQVLVLGRRRCGRRRRDRHPVKALGQDRLHRGVGNGPEASARGQAAPRRSLP